MVHRKKQSSLVRQQKRLLTHLDALSKTVAELETGMASELARAGRRSQVRASALSSLAGLKEKFRSKLGKKNRRSWSPAVPEASESNER